MNIEKQKLAVLSCHNEHAILMAYKAMTKALETDGTIERKTHKIEKGLSLIINGDSPYWWCKVSLPQKYAKPHRESTKIRFTDDINIAIQKAWLIQKEVLTKFEHGIIQAETGKTWKMVCSELRSKLLEESEREKSKTNKKRTMVGDYAITIRNRLENNKTLTDLNIKKVDCAYLHEAFKADEFQDLSKTVKTKINTSLKKIFEFAKIKRYIASSTTIEIPQFPKYMVGEETPRISSNDLIHLLENFDLFCDEGKKTITKRNRKLFSFYFRLLMNTGLRPGEEALGVRWSDIYKTTFKMSHKSLNSYVVKITKGKMSKRAKGGGIKKEENSREVILYSSSAKILEELYLFQYGVVLSFEKIVKKKNNNFLFVVQDQKTPDFSKILKQYCKFLEAKLSRSYPLYSLRHEFINSQLDAGIPIEDVAQQCGNSIQTIQTFYRKYEVNNRASRLLAQEDIDYFNR